MAVNNYYEKTVALESIANDPRKMLFYAIMYRRWDRVVEIVKKNGWSWEDIKAFQYEKFTDPEITVTVEECFAVNLDYLKAPKKIHLYTKLCDVLGGDFKDLPHKTIDSYDDKNFYRKSQSVLDVFWDGNQPILDVVPFEKQMLAAKQMMKNKYSMVLDEVGTGKTVAGIYAIQQVIQERIDQQKNAEEVGQVAILIVCPYNKRNDWYSDILKQLGRKSIIVEQGKNGVLYLRGGVQRTPKIYISGNKGGKDDTSDSQLKKSLLKYREKSWDLVIVDECHDCFDNYSGIRAKRALFLTATPIKVNANKIREFGNYKRLLDTIVDDPSEGDGRQINPIAKHKFDENDIFVCHFKEDIFSNIKIERQIEFVECERCERRQEWFNRLRYEKDFFTAIYSDQDDHRLADKMSKIFPDGTYRVTENKKLETLKALIAGQDSFQTYEKDSVLVFCETTDTINRIFDKISGLASDSLMVGKLYSNVAEIKNHNATSDTIIPILKQNIRDGKKSVLVTTGKSGGTGLNLGEFDTVIHYELPFSSNELEQRFGRIERADDLIDRESTNGRVSVKNKMVFLINQAVNGEYDFITNRMLYYAVNKIYKTVEYMPIRNTVLFHPAYMERVLEQARFIWQKLSDELNEAEAPRAKKLNALCDYLVAFDEMEAIVNKQQKDPLNKQLKSREEIILAVNDLVNNCARESIGDEYNKPLRDFYDTYIAAGDGQTPEYKELEKAKYILENYIEYYLWLKVTLALWGVSDEQDFALLAENLTEEKDEEDGAGNKKNEDNDEENKKIADDWNRRRNSKLNALKKETDRIGYVRDKIEDLRGKFDQIKADQSYSGVFYKDGETGMIVNKKFDE